MQDVFYTNEGPKGEGGCGGRGGGMGEGLMQKIALESPDG